MNVIRPLQKFLAVNSNDSAFAALADTLTEPSGDGVLDLSVMGGGESPCHILLYPYGLGADNDAFTMRLVGWTRIRPAIADGRFQWTPTVIAALGCIVSGDVGVAGGIVGATERYADTITVVTEGTITSDVTRGGTLTLTAPGTDVRAHVVVPIEGFEKLSLKFDQTTNTPTMNALYRLL